MFFHRVIRALRCRSIFSRTRCNLFIAYYICRNSCQPRGTGEKYRFSFDAIHAHLRYPPIYICLFCFYRRLICAVFLPSVAFVRPQTARYFQTSFLSARTQRTPTVRHLTVDRAGFMDRTILPVGLYDPRGEREYLLLPVHRQISPRSRISRFHFIYDKVAVASPTLLAGSGASVCAPVFSTCRCMGHERVARGDDVAAVGFRRGES